MVGAALSVLLLLAGLAVQARQAVAAQSVQTFGPGQVNCQALTGTRVDCLLGANRLTRDNRSVATFSVTACRAANRPCSANGAWLPRMNARSPSPGDVPRRHPLGFRA